jgi:hypothetical protein
MLSSMLTLGVVEHREHTLISYENRKKGDENGKKAWIGSDRQGKIQACTGVYCITFALVITSTLRSAVIQGRIYACARVLGYPRHSDQLECSPQQTLS